MKLMNIEKDNSEDTKKPISKIFGNAVWKHFQNYCNSINIVLKLHRKKRKKFKWQKLHHQNYIEHAIGTVNY